jgi:hypothetical protein
MRNCRNPRQTPCIYLEAFVVPVPPLRQPWNSPEDDSGYLTATPRLLHQLPQNIIPTVNAEIGEAILDTLVGQ